MINTTKTLSYGPCFAYTITRLHDKDLLTVANNLRFLGNKAALAGNKTKAAEYRAAADRAEEDSLLIETLDRIPTVWAELTPAMRAALSACEKSGDWAELPARVAESELMALEDTAIFSTTPESDTITHVLPRGTL